MKEEVRVRVRERVELERAKGKGERKEMELQKDRERDAWNVRIGNDESVNQPDKMTQMILVPILVL